jgi:2-dehydropantoate 2-reductase
LVTTKSQQTATALTALRTRLHPAANILILQNGLQGFADARRLLPDHRLLAGTTTEGVNRPKPGQWVHAGAGFTWIGPWSTSTRLDASAADLWLNALQQAGMQCAYDAAIEQRLWHKLLINCVINPLTVMFDCRNGELLQLPAAQRLMELLCVEAVQIMATLHRTFPQCCRMCDVASPPKLMQ